MPKRKKKITHERISTEKEMRAFLASKVVDQISDYNQRGRAYRELTDDQLVQSWQSIWNALATDTLNVKNRSIEADLASEFALRKQPPPWELVKVQINLFLRGAECAWEKQRRENPEADEMAKEAMDDDLEDFLTRRNRSN